MSYLVIVDLTLPKKVEERFRLMAEAQGLPIEAIIAEAVVRRIGDPEVEVELHLKLCEKFLLEGQELLMKGDYLEASEKHWGAVAQAVKAVAAKQGLELKTHGQLWDFVNKLVEKLKDLELGDSWIRANALHKNFYEGKLIPELAKKYMEDARNLVEKLKKLINNDQ